MDKSPAFQWYPRDILASWRYQSMDLEQQAAYRNLLDRAWLNDPQGYLPDDDEQLRGMSGWNQRPLDDRWTTVKQMFKKCSTGLYNPRQMKELKKQEKHRVDASRAGKASAAKRKQDATPVNARLTPVNTAVAVAPASAPASKKTGAASPLEFFPSLNDEDFRAKWAEWEQHRKEIRKPIRPSQAKKALEKLVKLGRERAARSIDNSIANGWQGLFDPDQISGKPGAGSKRPQTSGGDWSGVDPEYDKEQEAKK